VATIIYLFPIFDSTNGPKISMPTLCHGSTGGSDCNSPIFPVFGDFFD